MEKKSRTQAKKNLKQKLTCFLRIAKSAYNPLHAAVMPAASALYPARLRYEEKSRTGGKSMGTGCRGRRCWAVTRVARRVGGTEEAVSFLGQDGLIGGYLDGGFHKRGRWW